MENILPSRKNCPPSKEIISFFKSKTSEKHKSRLIDHITKCSSCSQEFEFILQTHREKGKLINRIGKLLKSRENIVAVRKGGDNKIHYLSKKRKSLRPRLSWKYAIILAGAAFIISIFFVFLNIGDREYRGPVPSKIRLIEPINGKYSKSPPVFKWNEFKDSEYYIIELFDETLFQIWESDKITKTDATVPAEIARRLKIKKTYFWMVIAFLPDGRKIESEMEEFILTN